MPRKEVENSLSDNDKKECLVKFRKLLSENEKLCVLQDYDESYLNRFLDSTNLNVEKAFKRFRAFYDLLEEHPEWFTKETPNEKKNVIDQDIRILTNIQDNQGRPVYIVKLANIDTSKMELTTDVVATDDFFMELLFLSYPEYRNGICVIVDVSNLPWSLLKWLTPSSIRIALKRMHTMPIKEYKFHVVNSSWVLNLAINILWPFLPQHIKDGVEFHFEDWDSLHKHISKEVLPTEFGGHNFIDYTKLRDRLYERDSEIVNNLKQFRQPYLNHVEKKLCKH